jgi:hypothetical protein
VLLMTEEAKAIMSFGQLKRGDRLQVDIHDPVVAGLIKGGYLKIIWKEPSDARTVEGSDDPGWADCLFSDRVDAGALQEAEAQVDGPRESEPGEGDRHSAPAGGSSRSQNGEPDDSGR